MLEVMSAQLMFIFKKSCEHSSFFNLDSYIFTEAAVLVASTVAMPALGT